MDFSKVFDSEILSDVKLILIDRNNNKKSLNLHKIILYTGSSFFEKMFDKFKEKNQSEIVLEVFDVDIFSDVLKSFYGFEIKIKKNWKYQLGNYICHQYLLLECELPETLKIPENEFEEFLDITQLLEYTDRVIKIVADNLPFDFDLNKLSIELIKEIEKFYVDYQILTFDNKNINIVDINNNKINTIIKGDLCSLDYIKDFDIILTKKTKNCEYIYYDSSGNLLDLSKINEDNNKYKYLSENLNNKHFKYVKNLLGENQNYQYFNYSPDYKNIVFVTYSFGDGYDSDDERYWSRCLYIYNIDKKKLKNIYTIINRNSSKYIQEQPLFFNDKIIFLEGNYKSSEIKIYSINNRTIKTIGKIDSDSEIKYNGEDLILITTDQKNSVFSLSKNKIVNEFYFKREMDGINFISEEIIIAYEIKGKRTHIYVYNIITGSLIKKSKIELKIKDIKCTSISSPIKNKLMKYLNDLKE
ncbi:putative BTB/POZ domain-containing protein [Moumouvirus australiensis]|uniref:Putative BTB/POZ domain-containing protein n=1 Tax=Moumouvirus australiensis TaxID=2109587 RepID=A0A2P1EKL3_9VIRU|nr:putative BTB/POZ domain-containing protein [Moumouvirus australiensis]AVL94426.1 putative BTB/POZ domain-containing protein [Moumouvirus australiensis]